MPKMTPEAERRLLHQHGTKLCELAAINIIQAADRDLERKKKANAAQQSRNAGATKKDRSRLLRYAFPREAVMEAKTTFELLQILVKNPPIPKTRDEILLYDPMKLNEALELARQREREGRYGRGGHD